MLLLYHAHTEPRRAEPLYINQVEPGIVQCKNAYVERYQEEILTSQRANLRISLRFKQTHLLEINEAIVITENSLEFRLFWIWWVKCILRYIPPSEGVEGTTPDTEDTKIDRFYGKLN